MDKPWRAIGREVLADGTMPQRGTDMVATTYGNDAEAIALRVAAIPELIEAVEALIAAGPCDVCYEENCGGINDCTLGRYGDVCECHKKEEHAEALGWKALEKAKTGVVLYS